MKCVVVFFMLNITALTVYSQGVSKQRAVDTATVPAKQALSINKNRAIVPGKSIGRMQLNEELPKLYKRLGKPGMEDAAMGKYYSSWYAKPKSNAAGSATPYVTSTYAALSMGIKFEYPKVKSIRVTSPYFMTQNGLGVGSQLNTFLKVYPHAKKVARYTVAGKDRVEVYTDSTSGVSFEINAEGVCIAIGVHLGGVKEGYYYQLLEDVEIL